MTTASRCLPVALLSTMATCALAADDAVRRNLERYQAEVLVPGRGIGELQVGRSTLADVKALFGETNAFQHRAGSSLHHYANGLLFVTEPARDLAGVVRSINAKKSPYGDGAFRGKTDRGIGLGATPDEVVAAYGQPKDMGAVRSQMVYEIGVTFGVRYGRIDEIVIRRPTE